jgi:hypothetical protein
MQKWFCPISKRLVNKKGRKTKMKRTKNVFLSALFAILIIGLSALANAAPEDNEVLNRGFEEYLTAWQSAKQAVIVNSQGVEMLLVPWYKTSDSTTSSNLKDSRSGNCAIEGEATHNNFCVVTDEMSQYFLGLSMTRNQETINKYYKAMFNTIKAINSTKIASSSTGYGKNTYWKFHYDGNKIILDGDDTATDADSRFILTLLNLKNHPLISDSAFKSEAERYANEMCSDFLKYSYTIGDNPSSVGSGRSVKYWYAGGAKQTRNGAQARAYYGYVYPGYLGDASLAMTACYFNTNKQEYLDAARDTIEQFLIASAWTSDTGLRFPDGRSGHWTNIANQESPRYVCDSACVGGMDDADASRAVTLGILGMIQKDSGITVNDKLAEFLEEWTQSSAYQATTYPKQWKTNGQALTASIDAYENNGLASYVDLGTRKNTFEIRQEYIYRNKFDKTRSRFTANSESMGVYWPGFVINSLGIGIGRAAKTLGREQTTTTPVTTNPIQQPAQEVTIPEPTPTTEERCEMKQISTPVTRTITYRKTINQLTPRCTYGAAYEKSCAFASEQSDGKCRVTTYNTENGQIKIKACDKGEAGIEVYRHQAPARYTRFKACYDNACMSETTGYAKITTQQLTTTQTITEESIETLEVCEEIVTSPPVISEPLSPTPAPTTPLPVVTSPVTVVDINSLVSTCIAQGSTCTPLSQTISGTCRTNSFSSALGEVRIKTCDKGTHFEVYRERAPQGLKFKACYNTACIDEVSGFSRLAKN